MSIVLTHPDQGRRIDHQGYAPEIWIGLLLTGLYLLQSPPVIDSIGNTLEYVLDAILTVGSGICVMAAMLGTRWFFPRVRKRTSHLMHLIGLPLIIIILAWHITLAWHTYAISAAPNLILVALGGGLGLCIEIASVRMIIEIAEDLREPSQ